MKAKGNCIVAVLFFFSMQNLFAQTLTGTITDEQTRESVIGASIVLKGTTVGTVTDADGKFSLLTDVLPPFTIVVSIVGYVSQEIPVSNLEQPLVIRLKNS